jgi:hypothetical protein
MNLELAFAWLTAGGLGALVGAVEIFQRYRAEPVPALANRWGIGYVAFNGAVALIAFWVATSSDAMAGKAQGLDLMKWAATSGIASSVLLRTKLFDIRLADGKEASLGPEILVHTLLGVLDREIDRLRARSRFRTVRALFQGIDFERAKLRLPLQVFQAMQTVTEEETQRLMKRVAEIDELRTLDMQDKSYLLGFYLLDLVGEQFLTAILGEYRTDFASAKT